MYWHDNITVSNVKEVRRFVPLVRKQLRSDELVLRKMMMMTTLLMESQLGNFTWNTRAQSNEANGRNCVSETYSAAHVGSQIAYDSRDQTNAKNADYEGRVSHEDI